MSSDIKNNTSKLFEITVEKIIASLMILLILLFVVLGLYNTYLYITKPLVPVYKYYITDLGGPMFIDAIAMVVSWIATPIIVLFTASVIYNYTKKDNNL